MTMSLVCTSTNTISKQEHMATPSLNDQPFIDTTKYTTLFSIIYSRSLFYLSTITEPRKVSRGRSG
jgi:hypothetical protein